MLKLDRDSCLQLQCISLFHRMAQERGKSKRGPTYNWKKLSISRGEWMAHLAEHRCSSDKAKAARLWLYENNMTDRRFYDLHRVVLVNCDELSEISLDTNTGCGRAEVTWVFCTRREGKLSRARSQLYRSRFLGVNNTKYSFESSRRDLLNTLLCTAWRWAPKDLQQKSALQSQFCFKNLPKNSRNISNILQIFLIAGFLLNFDDFFRIC